MTAQRWFCPTGSLLFVLVACSRSPTRSEEVAPPVSVAATAASAPPLRSPPSPSVAASATPLSPPPPAPTTAGPLQVTKNGSSTSAANAERILHFGDSMVPLVGNFLKPMVHARGHRYVVETAICSKTVSWAQDGRLPLLIAKHDPDLILISLGSNELFETHLDEVAAATQKIVTEVQGRSCLWIGPPAWAKDAGFIDTLKRNLGHCRYLDSIALKLPRGEDGRHPTWTGGYRWASAVWTELGGTEPVPTES